MARQTTILCIDDEADILLLRRKLLESHGFRVITALSGSEALRLLGEELPVDLVLLDYVMPEMNGDEVAEQLKRLHPTLPVIMMSGHPDLPNSLLERVDGYVRKGQDPEVVVGVIHRTLAARR
ncbi:MAG: response regulator [Candidatus Sulfotelmatobacter sp.]